MKKSTDKGSILANADAIANVAVKDLEEARAFYEGMLGLSLVDAEGREALIFKSGHTSLIVYRSQYAGTNQATTLTWNVGNELDDAVRTLKAKGISFEHYEMPGVERQGDIHVAGDRKNAWFKDADGNILCLTNG